MSTYTPLSEYLKQHNNKKDIEKRLISGGLIAYGIPFDPDRDNDEETLTHYIKDGARYEFETKPNIEKIPQFVWQTGTINWKNCSVKIEQERNSSSLIHLKWWNNVTIFMESKNELYQSNNRQHLHIIMYETACHTLYSKNKKFPTAREVWQFLEQAIDTKDEYYDEIIQEITSNTIFFKTLNESENSSDFNSFQNQISKIRQKYKTHS